MNNRELLQQCKAFVDAHRIDWVVDDLSKLIDKALAQTEQPILSASEILGLWHNTPFAEDTEVEQVLFARLLLARYGIGVPK